MAFLDSMDHLIAFQFWRADRQDLVVTFTEPRPGRAVSELAQLPGVLRVEGLRGVPARLRFAHRSRTVALTAVAADRTLRPLVRADGHAAPLRPAGLIISATLSRVLGAAAGDHVLVEVLEGRRPSRRIRIAATIDDLVGLSAYLHATELDALMGEPGVVTGAALLVDARRVSTLAEDLRNRPAVASVAVKRDALETFRRTTTANLEFTLLMNVLFAGVIAFGVVYNAARVSLSEQGYDLASLRVLGFTRGEISALLLGELATLTMAALPVGTLLGFGLATAIVQTLQSEVYRFPLYVSVQSMAWGWLGTIGAAVVSGLIVRRRVDSLDLVAVLKVRE